MENTSLSLANPAPALTTGRQKLALALAGLGVVLLLLVWAAQKAVAPAPMLFAALGLMTAGMGLFVREEYLTRPEGIKNNRVWFGSLSARGVWGWLAAIVLTGFYTVLYFLPPQWFAGLTDLFHPLSRVLRGMPADKWFVYGTLYTFSVLVMGVKFMYKYRHNRYQLLRTVSVMFFQTGFSFLIPAFMQVMNQPEYYFTYFWPLKDYYGSPGAVQYYGHATSISVYFIAFSALMTFAGTPLLTYFFGKRWYCSWVCGCGGLADTAGDLFRHLSDKSLNAWKIERWMIHSVLVAVVLMTGLLWFNSWKQGQCVGQFFPDLFQRLRVCDRHGFQRRDRGRFLSADGQQGLVPLRVPAGGDPRHFSKEKIKIPHHGQRRAVHQLRQLQYVLRNGHRRAALRATRSGRRSRLLRGLWHLCRRVPARRIAPGRSRLRYRPQGRTNPHRTRAFGGGQNTGIIARYFF
ncbi:MAG: 4Fe-4S binding protein [Lewinellaceae bacterium]|nr:4Fe-4S binding protein [Lewinellaceae bacterium]